MSLSCFLRKYKIRIVEIMVFTIMVLSASCTAAGLGTFVMTFLGAKYESIWSMFFLVLVVEMLSWPFYCWAQSVPGSMLFGKDKVTPFFGKSVYFLMSMSFTVIAFHVFDYFCGSVTMNFPSIFMMAIVLPLVGLNDVSTMDPDKEFQDDFKEEFENEEE